MNLEATADMDLEKKSKIDGTVSSVNGKHDAEEKYLERTHALDGNLVYADEEQEPELHARTYVAVASMFLLNLVQLVALQGPPALLSYIGTDLNNTPDQTWIPNALTLVQAVLGPIISSASDTFQARKMILVISCVVSFIGAAIAPGSASIYRVIAAQILIGFGFAAAPLSYCVPSEILPRRWRPTAQAAMNVAACLGAILGPIIIGAFTENNRTNGWRNFYWVQMGLWGASAIGIFVGYKPPKRHTRLDHLSTWQKLGHLDLPGFFLLTAGLTLFLVGLNLGGNQFAWANVRVLTTMIIGLISLVAFGVYEWLGTKTGILHHDLFRGGAARTVVICICLIFIEGVLAFAYLIFYPLLTETLYEQDPLLLVLRQISFWMATGVSTVFWGYTSTKFRTIREPMFAGFLITTAGIVGIATLGPNQSANAIGFAVLAGIGFGAPLVLVVAGIQLATPHHLIATATAVTTSSRAIGTSTFTAIYAAALRTRLSTKLPSYIAAAALAAGLPPNSLPSFIEALVNNDTSALLKVAGVSPAIIGAGVTALRQAFADSIRVVYIIAAPFGAVACIACIFLPSMGDTMNYRVDAPVEALHAKSHPQRDNEAA